MRFKFFIFIFLVASLSSFGQKDEGGGINFSYNANYNRFYLSKHIQYSTPVAGFDEQKMELRSPDMFPDEYVQAFQFGFINHNKAWHDFKFMFQYMPKTEFAYQEYKLEGHDWQTFENQDTYQYIDMEYYMLTISHSLKINLAAHHLYLNLGIGGGGGVIRWPSFDDEGNDYYHLSYTVYPIGGIEILLGKHLGLNTEYHYQWGNSASQAMSLDGNKVTWEYHLEGHELSAGLNLYF